MLVSELSLDENVILEDRETGQRLAFIKISSFVSYPTHTSVRLGIDAPQGVRILHGGKKDLKQNGKNP